MVAGMFKGMVKKRVKKLIEEKLGDKLGAEDQRAKDDFIGPQKKESVLTQGIKKRVADHTFEARLDKTKTHIDEVKTFLKDPAAGIKKDFQDKLDSLPLPKKKKKKKTGGFSSLTEL